MINNDKASIYSVLGKYKSEEFLNLINKWIGNFNGKNVLKTDLREEAFGEDEILFSLSAKSASFFALDISQETTKRARNEQKKRGLNHFYLTADVRELPFRNNYFDIVLSSSTLDHFSSIDGLIRSLSELKRVSKPGAEIIIALNNIFNLNFYLMLKIEKALGLSSDFVQFYGFRRLRKIILGAGLSIKDINYIVHIFSPLNRLLLVLSRHVSWRIVDEIARISVFLSRWVGNRRKSKFLTGWFIVLKCIKE